MSSKLDKNKIFSGMATEHTLKEVVTAVKSINVNIGDIAFGDVNVQSDDVITHGKLDITNTAIGLTNNKLDLINNNLEDLTFIDVGGVNKLQVNIAGQTIAVNSLNLVARESTLSNIDEKIPNMLSDNGNRLLVNTEGQSVGISNFPENQLVTVNSGNINVDNFPATQQVAGSVNVSNMISGFATESTLGSVKTAIDNKRLQFANDSVSVTGSSVVVSNDITLSNFFTLDTTTQGTNTRLDNINTTIINKRLNSGVDSVNVGNMISGFNLEATQQEVSTKLTALKTAVEQKRLDQSLDSVTVVLENHSTDTLQTLGNSKLDTISSNIVNKRINKLQDSIDISGQSVLVNTISGFALDATSQITNDDLEKIIDKKGDIESSIFYDDGAPVWADTTPIPFTYYQDGNGWKYTNTNIGNAMNLFYFNGVNEIKTLSQLTGQYAVVTNTSTKVNSKMIFTVYTKSGSSFFTTRVTRSTNSSSFMVAGGKYLLYWGDVPDDLYPSLPRINFTNVVTTGPANPTEEILSVTLNSDSGAVAGELDIFVESLGVVFGSQSRVYNLYGFTKYFYLRNINNNLSLVKNNTDKNMYDTSGNLKTIGVVNTISGFSLDTTTQSTNTKLDTLNTTLSNKTLDKLTSSIDISGQTMVVNTISGFATSALQTTGNDLLNSIKNNSDKLSYDTSGNLKVNVVVGGGGGSVDGTVNIKDSSGGNITSTDGKLNTNITNASLAVTGAFFQATQPVSVDALPDVTITNTSFDSRLRDGENNLINSTEYGVTPDITRALDVSIKNATQADPLFVNIPATNEVKCFINNFPAEYAINAGGALSSAGAALFVNLRDTTGNPYGITGAPLVVESNVITGFSLDTTSQLTNDKLDTLNTTLSNKTLSKATSSIDVSGQTMVVNTISGFALDASTQLTNDKLDTLNTTLSNKTLSKATSSIDVSGQTMVVNTISGFALESGGNLESIKINSDKFKFEGNNLKCEVINSGTNNLNVTVSNPSTNYAIETGGNLASLKANSDKLIFDASGNLKVNVVVGGGGGGGGSGGIVNITDTEGKNIFSDASGHLTTVTSGRTATGISKELLITTAGNLIVEAKAHDGSNNPISSSINGGKRSLDVNITSASVSTSDPTTHQYLDDIMNINVDIRSNTFLTADSNSAISLNTSNIDTKLGTILTNSNKANYDASGNLKVNVVVGGGGGGSTDAPFGTFNNIVNNADLAASSFSNTLFINNLCGNETVISYEDTAVTQTSFISIYGGFDDTNYFYIGVLQPALIRANKRNASAVLKLKGLKYIKIYNENTSVGVTAVKATLFSG